MAASGSEAPRIGAGPLKGLVDPFAAPETTSATEPRRASQRYSAFDSQVFSQSQAGSSPSHAKAALEAHLNETDRRLEEASRLGTALVEQRTELAARLKEVEAHQEEEEIGPELKQKLMDVEKEFNDLGRDSTRAFLAPKAQGQAGGPLSEVRNPASPTKFSSQATDSPSKVTVPSRKQRNQPSNRVHDIEFATEISTSLLAQVRQLQGVLAERDESLRKLAYEKSQMEVDHQGLTQRVRNLNESEQHYKDENWNLETKTHDLIAAQKESSAREQRLQQSLALVAGEKSSMQRDMEELKAAHGKLTEDHAAFRKAYDVDVAGMKKNANLADSDRGALQNRIDDLTAQNQELANAIASRPRGENAENAREAPSDPEDFSLERDEHDPSPPPSPSKGGRNSMLESETLKSSLNHAHRMIQTLKTNVHREKSEKIELKRLLQETRDELELRRAENGAASKRAKTKPQQELKNQGKIGQLGPGRSGTTEIEFEDDDWEEHQGRLESRGFAENAPSRTSNYSEVYQTADETEDAYETAQERDETDEFLTGTENPAHDSSDDLTETETGPAKTKTSKLVKATPPPMDKRASYQSTASTTDGGEDSDQKTPAQSTLGSIKNRFRLSRGSRKSRIIAAESVESTPGSTKDSPASFRAQPGKSLAAELVDFDNESIGGSVQGTPSRSATASRGATPARDTVIYSSVPPVPKMPTTDIGVMTDTATATEERAPSPELGFSAINSVEMEPDSSEHVDTAATEAASAGVIGSVFGWAIGKRQSTPVPGEAQDANGTPRGKEPLSEVSGNAVKSLDWSDKLPVDRKDQGSQTMLSADQIDSLLAAREQRGNAVGGVIPLPVPVGKAITSPTSEGVASSSAAATRDVQPNSRAVRRPASSGSGRGRVPDVPPLPSDHRQAIAAASSTPDRDGAMGPPAVPASAYRTTNRKPQSPTEQQSYGPNRIHTNFSTPRGGARFSTRSQRSRASSVSSFESELDARFNIRPDGQPRADAFANGTDPRMIQAITQTMIGEYLWKYTRKAGRGNMSDKRHRRFFWVHPYTRTLYWSDQDPSTAGRAQLKAKSVQIEAVRVVADDNPMPPGLHRKSLMLIAPGRDIKFTATTGQRHETWFNALSYLLLRGGPDAMYPENYNAEDVAEFNPGGNSMRQSTQSRVSLSTYNSRTTTTRHSRASSREGSIRRQALAQSFGGSFAPRLPPPEKESGSVGSRLSSLLRPNRQSTMSTAAGKAPARAEEGDIYDARVVANDSAEDVRQHLHQQDQDADRMENVRSCCDGKHDVGSLSRHHTGLSGRIARDRGSATTSGAGTGTGTGTLVGGSQTATASTLSAR